MLSAIFSRYWWQFILLYFIQAMVFKDLVLGLSGSLSIVVFIYPVIILILPLSVPRTSILFIAFVMGFLIDLWYNSAGVHAAALLLTAFARPYVVSILLDDAEIRSNLNQQALTVKLPTYMSYAIILYLIHTFTYFCLEQFSMDNFGALLMKSIFSALFSFFFAVIYRFVLGNR